jgi:hypothetical protein
VQFENELIYYPQRSLASDQIHKELQKLRDDFWSGVYGLRIAILDMDLMGEKHLKNVHLHELNSVESILCLQLF